MLMLMSLKPLGVGLINLEYVIMLKIIIIIIIIVIIVIIIIIIIIINATFHIVNIIFTATVIIIRLGGSK